jgi:hypothetical protein
MVGKDLNDHVAPALVEGGAQGVLVGESLTGPTMGTYVLNSQWESLGAGAASSNAMTTRMAPGGDLADLAGRYQPIQRIISQTMFEAGSSDGAFISASRFTFTSPLGGLENTGQIATTNGANGARISSVLAGGDMTGHLIGAMFFDSLDALPGLLASFASDPQFMADVAAAGGHLESRTIFQRV